MTRPEMVAAVEQEIARLEQIRALLAKTNSGRFAAPAVAAAAAKGKRTLSPEARKRIAQGQARRWAKKRGTENAGEAGE